MSGPVAFPEHFETARLRADRLTRDHWPELCRMHADPVVMAHLGGVRDAAWTAAYLERNLLHWTQHGYGLWILSLPGGELAGRAVLRHLLVDGVDEVEVGYGFYQHLWGHGLASEITTACLRHGRDHLRLPSIVAVTSPGNLASQRVLARCGLDYERDTTIDGARMRLFRTTITGADAG